MKSGFEVLHGGILTTLQDYGRYGFNPMGVTHSGVMDEYAYFWANKLLNNNLKENCMEILLSHLTLK